jgi:hypothetical protein
VSDSRVLEGLVRQVLNDRDLATTREIAVDLGRDAPVECQKVWRALDRLARRGDVLRIKVSGFSQVAWMRTWEAA